MSNNMQNSLVNLAAPTKPKQVSKKPSSGAKTENSQKDEFSKLMNQQNPGKKPESEDTTNAVPQEENTTAQAIPSMKDLDEELKQRMLLAAMLLGQAPQEMVEEPSAPVEELVDAVEQVEDTSVVQTSPLMQEQTPMEELKPQEEAAPVAEEIQAQPQTQQEKPVERPQEDRVELQHERPQVQEKEEKDPSMEKLEFQQGTEVENPLFRDLKVVPVKVGEAETMEKAEQPPVNQVHDRLAEAIRNGDTTMEMELTPHHLGRVKVEMIWHNDGSMHVILHADKPKTQALLDRDAGQLQSLLGRNSQQEVHVEVPRGQESQRPQYYEDEQGHHQQQQERQQEHRQKEHKDSDEDFLHQLRLGLSPIQLS